MLPKRVASMKARLSVKSLEAALVPLQSLLQLPKAGIPPGVEAVQVPVQQGPTQAVTQYPDIGTAFAGTSLQILHLGSLKTFIAGRGEAGAGGVVLPPVAFDGGEGTKGLTTGGKAPTWLNKGPRATPGGKASPF